MQKSPFLFLLALSVLSFSACSTAQNTAQLAAAKTEQLPEAAAAPKAEVLTSSTAPVILSESQNEIKWLKLEEAYALNKKEPRKIFVDVYTDWCGWCKKMDKETFANAEVAQYANENFYAVKLDAESDREFELDGEKMTERAVARQLGATSFPTIILIHEDFQKFQPVPGYRPAKDFKEILTKFKAIDINQKQ